MRFYLCFLSFFMVITSFAADALMLWPEKVPSETTNYGPEVDISVPGKQLVAGKSVIRLANVSNPAITIFSPPADKNNGTAIMVCPGGGYHILAYDLEGTEVCSWLNSIGVTAVLLKYRVPVRPNHQSYEVAIEDAQRALSLIRSQADKWQVRTNRIGVLGFSAGGHLCALASCQFNKRSYKPVDAVDQISCRPDFAVVVYPAFLVQKTSPDKISPELIVTSNTPPTFLVQTEHDNQGVENSLYYYLALKNADVPAELHIFPKGIHGYGLRPCDSPVSTIWPKLVEQWLQSSNFLEKEKPKP